MDRFTGRARLEWWANQAICLEAYTIDITDTADTTGTAGTWQATGRHAPALDSTQREGWGFLMEMDPYFSIVFPGKHSSGILVRVLEAEDSTLTLIEVPEGGWSDEQHPDLPELNPQPGRLP
ncbi:hypothetical protein ACIGG5_32565 [Streptomyces sp. NPDC085463]|uniref:hypothetical protein n=1 Tax=Streptomyces sp. NPDC085463 TaxID=3365724 RepID=UPI0037D90B63